MTFTLERGEVHALLGENGAGKSTLTKMLAGVVSPTSGQGPAGWGARRADEPADALRKGIAMVYQETSLVPSLTVAQNLYLADARWFNRLRRIYIAAQQFLQSLNFPVDPAALVSSLGAGQKQMVEIARAVHHKAGVIIFDEPTGTLTPEEKHHFFALVKRLKTNGVSIIFISHAVGGASGSRIGSRSCGTASMSSRMRHRASTGAGSSARWSAGRCRKSSTGKAGRRQIRPAGRKVRVSRTSPWAPWSGTTFSVFAGQITGVFGLIGSGHTETAKVVSGVM